MTIREPLLDGTNADPTPPEVALGKNEAAAIYVAKDGPSGALQIMRSPDGKAYAFSVTNDGQPHFDLV